MKTKPILLTVLIAVQMAVFWVNPVQAATDPNDAFAVKVVANVSSTSPWTITLTWPAHTGGGIPTYTVKRKTLAGSFSTLHSNASSPYVDQSSLSSGATYEYEVVKTFNGDTGYGYASVSLGAAALESRGKVILIVDSSKVGSLATELSQFSQNLIGDGWSVVQHTVLPDDPGDRANRVEAVKDLVQAEYDADPTNVKSVVLIGHIPVPYSGVFDISGHPPQSKGAHPADVYYGDVIDSELWSDSVYGDTESAWNPNNDVINDRKDNWLEDGKFDNNEIPSNVELQVGRIDFYDLGGAFPSKSETQLLQQYFQKNHNYRHKINTLSKTALLADLKSGGYWPEWAPLATGWGRFSGLLNGAGNLSYYDNSGGFNFITHLASNERYITQIAGTSGSGPSGMDPSYSSSHFAANDIKTFFIALGASYIPDWDTTDNFLRASLGSATYSLCAMTGDNPSFAFHRLNTGATWGEILRLSQNNRKVSGVEMYHHRYWNDDPNGPDQELNGLNRVHIALLGDPTLRFHVVKPVSSFTKTINGSTVTLNWGSSTDLSDPPATGEGYFVYRAFTRMGPFERISGSSMTTSRQLIQYNVPKGRYCYMVRAVKRTATHEGFYYNLSQGVFLDDVDMSTSGAAWNYTEISPAGFPSGDFTSAAGLNNNAVPDVVGSYTDYPSMSKGIRNYNGTSSYFSGNWSASDRSQCISVNDGRVLVGSFDKYDSVLGYNHHVQAFKATSSGTITLLDNFPFNSFSYAQSINSSGIVVGYAWNGSAHRAVKWEDGDGDGDLDLNDLLSHGGSAQSARSFAYSINSAGVIVGKSVVQGSNNERGFLLLPGRTLAVDADGLGALGGNQSAAYDVNDLGQVVGTAQNADVPTQRYRAFIRQSGASTLDQIPLLFGQSATVTAFASGINSGGQVVGNSGDKAFLWDSRMTEPVDLNSFKPSSGPTITLESARDINNRGAIVGYGS